MRKVCVSTGCFWMWSNDINKRIELVSSQKIDGVELGFKYPGQLFGCNLTKENLDYLNGLKFNTIHTPMRHNYKNSARTRKIMRKVAELYDAVNAKFVIIHPWRIKRYGIIENPGRAICIENDIASRNNRSRKFCHIKGIKEVLDAHPEMNLVLDVCHAGTHSYSLTGEFVEEFGSKIKYVHASASEIGKEQHQAIHLANPKFLESIEPIKKLKCPIVLETYYPKGHPDYYARDIAFLKEFARD